MADQLRVARERAGLSIEELSARTKIRVAALEALEQGEFARLPGDFYIRSFLKTYAREVCLPEHDLLLDYDGLHAAAEPEPPPQPMASRAVLEPSSRNSLTRSVVLKWPSRYSEPAAVAVVLVVLMMLVSFRRPADNSRAVNASPVGTAAAAETSSGPAHGLPAAVGTTGVTAAPDKLVIDIQPNAPIWVTATADGRSAIRRLLKPGEHVMIDAQQALSFRIGNAAAFIYTINGVPGKTLGGPDDVREFDITRENYQTYRR